MIREICKDRELLAQPGQEATAEDRQTARDLLDTLKAHADGCVGMAANMIGVCKRIVAFEDGDGYRVMYNPVILKKTGGYWADEACLSLPGLRNTRRFKTIQVEFRDESFEQRVEFFTGWTAQILQHEIDHCNGILI